ncbi:MAG: hypothetical protein PUB98_00650 [Clostridiales bacterium]|nr:hypothetical protein [Clostridiales bacterium]
MYSQDKIDVALKVYHECGSVTTTIRVLGYPTRRALYTWIANEEEDKSSKARRRKAEERRAAAGRQKQELGARDIVPLQMQIRELKGELEELRQIIHRLKKELGGAWDYAS